MSFLFIGYHFYCNTIILFPVSAFFSGKHTYALFHASSGPVCRLFHLYLLTLLRRIGKIFGDRRFSGIYGGLYTSETDSYLLVFARRVIGAVYGENL